MNMKLTKEDISYITNEAVRIVSETILSESRKKTNSGKKIRSGKKGSKDSFGGESKQTEVHGLKNKGLNLAQYAYRLYPDMDKASARSKFYKKVKHEKVTDGYSKKKSYKYSLTPSEATAVNNLINKPLAHKK